jgi:hypothetical protein
MRPDNNVDEEFITFATDAGHFPIAHRRDEPAVLPDGTVQWRRHTTLFPSAAGASLSPNDRVVTCQLCGLTPLHESELRHCSLCEVAVCRDCRVRCEDEQRHVCVPCARQTQRRELVQFFCTFR